MNVPSDVDPLGCISELPEGFARVESVHIPELPTRNAIEDILRGSDSERDMLSYMPDESVYAHLKVSNIEVHGASPTERISFVTLEAVPSIEMAANNTGTLQINSWFPEESNERYLAGWWSNGAYSQNWGFNTSALATGYLWRRVSLATSAEVTLKNLRVTNVIEGTNLPIPSSGAAFLPGAQEHVLNKYSFRIQKNHRFSYDFHDAHWKCPSWEVHFVPAVRINDGAPAIVDVVSGRYGLV